MSITSIFSLGLFFYVLQTTKICSIHDASIYYIAQVSSIGDSSALQDDVMDSYATCVWNLTVLILGGLLLLRPIPITSIHSREMEIKCPGSAVIKSRRKLIILGSGRKLGSGETINLKWLKVLQSD